MVQSSNTLSSLLEESRRLTTHLSSADIPAVERGLDILESESRKLVAKSVRAGHGIDPRAQSLLASTGVDAEELAESKAPLALLSAFEMLQPTYDANVESFLVQQQEQSIVSAIEESELTTLDDFDRNMTAHMEQMWEETQGRLFEELGQYQGSCSPSGGGGGRGAERTFDDSYRESTARISQPRVHRYGAVVRRFNDARVSRNKGQGFDLLGGLEKATLESSEELKSKHIGQLWKLLAHYTTSRADVPGQACKYLEATFVEHVERIIAQYPHEANVGGVPSIHRKIQGYLRVQFGRGGRKPAFLEVFNGDPIWAHMFLLHRCGQRQELLKYALDMEDIIADSDPGFVAHLKAFFDGPDKLRSAPHSVLPSSLDDPYKAALYRALGRGNVPKKTAAEIVHTTEDYLWSHLVLVRDADAIAAAGQARPALRDVQDLVLKFGPAHFDPNGNNPVLYFRVLVLSGLLEHAVDYLVQSERYQIEAVHIAILLASRGLLRVTGPDPAGSFANYLVSEGAATSFDFSKMVVHYAHALPTDSDDEEMHYLLLLTLPSQEEIAAHQKRVCEQAIVRMLYERRNYTHFVGDIRSDGVREPGELEKYLSLVGIDSYEQFTQVIVKRLADRSRDEGRLADSVLLYNFAGKYNTVLAVLCKQLGEVLFLRNNSSGAQAGGLQDQSLSELDDVEAVARAVLENYKQREHIARVLDEHSASTCALLLAIIDFLHSYDRGAYEDALAKIEATGLVPMTGDVGETTQHAERVRALDDAVTRNFSLVLLAAMDTLSCLYAGLRESPFVDTVKRASMENLRKKARALMVFAGMIQFRMPPDTYAKLNRLDVFMN